MATIDQRIYSQAIADGMPSALALLIVAQSKHETNDYESAVFNDCNNAFGYSSTDNSCPGHSFYQAYNSPEESTSELTGWIKRRLSEGNFPALETINDPTQYATLLKNNGYYTDSISNYAAGLINWFEGNIQTVGISLGTISIIIAAIFLMIRRKSKV